jgi:pyruvate/2-oxoacid:ferredoxin oxidoreductase beta subunit/Pyruvate/2-oxoacid:ferredoxin oxidoreductase gamma subunit
MDSLLNTGRPPVFCPGCSHERVVNALDKAFSNMGIPGDKVVLVSDIGCSGLFDTFFNTHAFHGLHGRALTYATGIKMAQPDLNVIVTMGDGGLGIGGAHLLAACRRNLNITLLILNNFNFGMTGGQFSATTPPEAHVGSAFLNRLEKPIDVCSVARSAGAPFVSRCSSYSSDLTNEIEKALRFEGFSLIDMWGICPGRYTKRNKLTPQIIDESLAGSESFTGVIKENLRKEYGRNYSEIASGLKKVMLPSGINTEYAPPESGRREVIILGSAGQRIITAGDILCTAGMTAGLNVTQKNDYNITVLRGPSISEIILSPEEIGFSGIAKPSVIITLAHEGVDRRKYLFGNLDENTLIIRVKGVDIPETQATVFDIDLKEQGFKNQDWALASLAVMAGLNKVISIDMLNAAIKHVFKDKILESAINLINRSRSFA